MNSNLKLFPSALGLIIGLWMIACGGPDYDVINTEKPGGKTARKSKSTGLAVSKRLPAAGYPVMASARKSTPNAPMK
ncbi:hypothetical protein [Larkinella ripae]